MCIAQTTMEKDIAQNQERLDYLKSQGIIYLGDGVHIMPEKNINPSFRFKENLFEINYKEKINNLNDLKNSVNSDLSLNIDSKNIHDTHWHKTYKELKLSYEFKEFPSFIKILGYTPATTYKNGWNGISIALELENFGYCQYNEYNIKNGHLSINLPQEKIKYDINKKASIIETYGDQIENFLYEVNWYDDNFSYELTCTTSKYSDDNLKYVIDAAKHIDAR